MTYRKVITLGTVSGGNFGYSPNYHCPVEITVELRDTAKGTELAIQGAVWLQSRRDIISGGQNYDTLAELFPNDAKVQRIIEIWRRWHLNGLNAACERQRALGWTWDTHPSESCPECGYRLGSAWLYEELPADVIAEVMSW